MQSTSIKWKWRTHNNDRTSWIFGTKEGVGLGVYSIWFFSSICYYGSKLFVYVVCFPLSSFLSLFFYGFHLTREFKVLYKLLGGKHKILLQCFFPYKRTIPMVTSHGFKYSAFCILKGDIFPLCFVRFSKQFWQIIQIK